MQTPFPLSPTESFLNMCARVSQAKPSLELESKALLICKPAQTEKAGHLASVSPLSNESQHKSLNKNWAEVLFEVVLQPSTLL